MTERLKEWTSGDRSRRFTDELTEWPIGEEQPLALKYIETDSYPFEPASGINRAAYSKMRMSKLPLLCYVANYETSNCITISPDGQVVELAVQYFLG